MEMLRPQPWLRIVCGVAAAAIVFQLLVLPEPAFAAQIVEATWDKAVHALAYAFLSLLVWIALGTRWTLVVFLVAVTVGTADELHQIFTPGRTADVNDLLADAFGAAVAMIFAQFLRPVPTPGTQAA
jgi:VanZ family protein